MDPNFENLITFAGLIVAVLVSIATLLKLVAQFVDAVARKIEAIHEKKNQRPVILKPTTDELSKYSVRIPQKSDPRNDPEIAEYQSPETKSNDLWQAQSRLAVMLTVLLFVFSIIIARLLYIGLYL